MINPSVSSAAYRVPVPYTFCSWHARNQVGVTQFCPHKTRSHHNTTRLPPNEFVQDERSSISSPLFCNTQSVSRYRAMIDSEFTIPEYPKKKRKLTSRRHVANDSNMLLQRPVVVTTRRRKAISPKRTMISRDTTEQQPSATVLLQQCMLDSSERETPAMGRCSSTSSLSEQLETTITCPLDTFIVAEARCPSPSTIPTPDNTLRTTYTLTKRRSYSHDRAVAVVSPPPQQQRTIDAPPSPSLRLRMRDSINVSKRRLGEMRQRLRQKPRSKWLIPADHPYKLAWDMLTVMLSLLGAYATHASIRDRSFHHSYFVVFCEVWFLVDILLNFVTEHKTSEGLVIRDGKAVWARYLTTWFVVDALSLVPWESLYIKPIIDMQNRRGFFKKTFFRSRAVLRVTRVLRGRHFRWFGQVASHTKHAGVGANRLLRLIIKYLPKYLLFYRNMKAVLAVRTLRQVHWFRKVFKSLLLPQKEDDDTYSLSEEEEDLLLNDDDDDVHVFEYEPPRMPLD